MVDNYESANTLMYKMCKICLFLTDTHGIAEQENKTTQQKTQETKNKKQKQKKYWKKKEKKTKN